MSNTSRREIVELWQRAQEALRATSTLLTAGFSDFAAARAYYAAFYAASALLLTEGKEFRSHRGVVGLMHRDYVRTGRLPVDMGRILSTLSDLRSVGDYGGAAHISHTEARIAHVQGGVVRLDEFCCMVGSWYHAASIPTASQTMR